MNKFKGSKGKWIKKQDEVWSGEKKICKVIDREFYKYYNTEEEANYNAQLISCAPELLSMVQLLVERLEENDLGNFNAVSRAYKLIEKATEL